MSKAKANWLDRRIAAPGPHLALCLDEYSFNLACQDLGVGHGIFIPNDHSSATVHRFYRKAGLAMVVCLRDWEGCDPVEIAGLLVHEAVHVWQAYAENIGERNPGDEQEAYAIQAIAQELMAEFAKLTGGGN